MLHDNNCTLQHLKVQHGKSTLLQMLAFSRHHKQDCSKWLKAACVAISNLPCLASFEKAVMRANGWETIIPCSFTLKLCRSIKLYHFQNSLKLIMTSSSWFNSEFRQFPYHVKNNPSKIPKRRTIINDIQKCLLFENQNSLRIHPLESHTFLFS